MEPDPTSPFRVIGQRFMGRCAAAAASALLLGVLIGACGGDDDAGDASVDFARGPDVAIEIGVDEPLVIGVSLALTGPIGRHGSEYRDAVILGVDLWKEANGDRIAGHEIEVRAEDDGCSEPGVAAVAAQRFVQTRGLVGIIGPMCSGGSQVAMPILADAGIVAISGSATRTDLTTTQAPDGFFFRTAYRNDLEGAVIGDLVINTLAIRRWYLIDDSSAFGVDLADAAQAFTDAAGVTTVRERIARGDVDFGDLARRIAADTPDIVGFTGPNPEAALLLRQIRDAGYEGLFVGGDAAASQRLFVSPIGASAEGTLFSGCYYPLEPEVAERFVERYDYYPSETFVSQYVDAVTILLDAVSAVAEEQPGGSLSVSPSALRDAVRTSYHGDAMTGSIAFDDHGDRVPMPGDVLEDVVAAGFADADADILVVLGLIMCQVQDGELVPLAGSSAREPRGFAAGE